MEPFKLPTSAAPKPAPRAVSPRDGRSLPMDLAGDVACALVSSLALSPFVTAIDKGIIQAASGSSSMGASIGASLKELAFKPISFLRRPEFALVYGVYAVTYGARNTIDTACEHLGVDPDVPIFLGVSAVNVTACVAKDAALARMFGKGPAAAVPLLSLALFTTRDCATIGASFNLPSKISAYLQEGWGTTKSTADNLAQLLCPMGVQFFSTPIHLLGLSLYNNSARVALGQRIAQDIAPIYAQATIGRVCRVAPAFGFGGIGNRGLRNEFRAFTAGLTPKATTTEVAAEALAK